MAARWEVVWSSCKRRTSWILSISLNKQSKGTRTLPHLVQENERRTCKQVAEVTWVLELIPEHSSCFAWQHMQFLDLYKVAAALLYSDVYMQVQVWESVLGGKKIFLSNYAPIIVYHQATEGEISPCGCKRFYGPFTGQKSGRRPIQEPV